MAAGSHRGGRSTTTISASSPSTPVSACGIDTARRPRRPSTATPVDDWIAEHNRLFEGGVTCPPNETAYVRRDKGVILADINGFYRAFGFEPAEDAARNPTTSSPSCSSWRCSWSWRSRRRRRPIRRRIDNQASAGIVRGRPPRRLDRPFQRSSGRGFVVAVFQRTRRCNSRRLARGLRSPRPRTTRERAARG